MKKLVLVLMVLGMALPVLADIVANDDVTTRGSSIYNNSDPFGLMAKQPISVSYRDVFWVEFTLGTTAVSSATLELDNQYAAGSGWNINLKAGALDFDDESFAIPDSSSWTVIGTINGVSAVGIYGLDITSWYNANLGQTMTIEGYTTATGGGSAPIFDDSEGTLGGVAPTIVTVPEPATMALLGLGALVLRRKR